MYYINLWRAPAKHMCKKHTHIVCMSKQTHTRVTTIPGGFVCVCVCARALRWLITGLVFSNVRFRNAHSLHNSSRSITGKSGWGGWEREHTAMYVSIQPLPLMEGITGENLSFVHTLIAAPAIRSIQITIFLHRPLHLHLHLHLFLSNSYWITWWGMFMARRAVWRTVQFMEKAFTSFT